MNKYKKVILLLFIFFFLLGLLIGVIISDSKKKFVKKQSLKINSIPAEKKLRRKVKIQRVKKQILPQIKFVDSILNSSIKLNTAINILTQGLNIKFKSFIKEKRIQKDLSYFYYKGELIFNSLSKLNLFLNSIKSFFKDTEFSLKIVSNLQSGEIYISRTNIELLSIKYYIRLVQTVMKPSKPFLCFLIDDFGYGGKGDIGMINSKVPMTISVIPGLKHSKDIAKKANKIGLEVFLHQPMETLSERKNQKLLGPLGIKVGMSADSVKKIINKSLSYVPYAVGMNNHMGSKATQDKKLMHIVLSIIKSKNLYFVDSKTSAKSIAYKVAKSLKVPCAIRDIFIDNIKNSEIIKKEIKKGILLSLQKGSCLMIGHAHPETVKAIVEMYPEINKLNIEVVSVSNYIKKLSQQKKGTSFASKLVNTEVAINAQKFLKNLRF